MTRIITPSQTVGPFFAFCLTPGEYDFAPLPVAERGPKDSLITVRGQLLDGAGQPVPDAFIEIWHADERGLYRREGQNTPQSGFARCPTDGNGEFVWTGVRPGPVPMPGGNLQAPHLNISIFARGLLDRLVTRLYFEDSDLNPSDPILSSLSPERRATLIAKATDTRLSYFVHEVRLQGDAETVFFAV